MTLWTLNSISSHLCCYGPLHLVFPGDVGYVCNNIQQVASEEEEEERDTLHIDTMQRCELTSFMAYINDKIHDIRERNVTTRSEI